MKKIIDDIMLEAKTEAEQIIEKARSDAQARHAAAEAECAALEKHIADECLAELARLEKRRASARASKQRGRLLEVKHNIIESEIEKAYSAAAANADDEVLLSLLEKRLRSGECVIYFPSGKEPSDNMRAQIKRLAEEAGCKYRLSYDRESVKNGFVLVYGGIEENCTFEALFEEHRSEITDAAAELLFGTEV